jgi:hypothetical protein
MKDRAGRPEWAGRTVVCIASGPSLTAEDCEIVRASGHPVIVCNTTYQMARWADVLFACDARWWRHYHEDVTATFPGRKLTVDYVMEYLGVESLCASPWFQRYGNTGACAVSFGIAGNPDRVVMLGYDCQRKNGEVHWHGDHPKGFTNGKSIALWPNIFRKVARQAEHAGVEVINASRVTALNCFERMELEDALL